jgi:hypothetical protein
MLRKGIGWLTLAMLAQEASAAVTVQRCVSERGQLTFTHTTCPDGLPGEPYQVWNAPPGSVAAIPPATPPTPTPRKPGRTPAAAKPAPQAKAIKPAPLSKARKKKPPRYTPWAPSGR